MAGAEHPMLGQLVERPLGRLKRRMLCGALGDRAEQLGLELVDSEP